MAVTDRAALERRRVKVESFLEENSVKLPLIEGYTVESDNVNLVKNKEFQRILKHAILPEIVATIKSDMAEDDFFKMERYQWLKQHINFSIRNKQMGSEFKSAMLEAVKTVVGKHKDFLIKRYNLDVLSKTMMEATQLAQRILLSSMIVDSMSDCDYNWLDFSLSMASATITICEGDILSIGRDNINYMLEVSSDYIDHQTVMLSLFIFKLFRQLDEQSKDQLMGNLGSMYEIRDSVEYAFSREILSKPLNTRWLMETIIQNRETLLETDSLSPYFTETE